MLAAESIYVTAPKQASLVMETVPPSGFPSSPCSGESSLHILGAERMADANNQEQESAGLCDKPWDWLLRESRTDLFLNSWPPELSAGLAFLHLLTSTLRFSISLL